MGNMKESRVYLYATRKCTAINNLEIVTESIIDVYWRDGKAIQLKTSVTRQIQIIFV